jgi:hypothetical protein
VNDSRPTVEDCARAALAACDSDVALILAEQWVSERYANLAARTPLRTLHKIAAVTVPGIVSEGTVTVEEGSQDVTGDATAIVAWGNAIVGRLIQLHTAWYVIESLAGGVLRLATPYVEDAVTAGSYRIVQRYVALADDARTLGDFVLEQRHARLRKLSQADLDYWAPNRQHFSYGPTMVVDSGVNASNQRLMEFYPYPQTAMQVRYDYWAAPPRLELTDPIPGAVDLHVLKEGVMIDVMRHHASRAMKAGDVNAAGYWRNEARAQETAWEDHVKMALLNDRGIDDVEMRMRSSQGSGHGLDIMSAYDELWARGSRP